MQKTPKVTVIIPNYNGLKFMDQCMNALAGQTYTDFAVLIVDNGSKDGSVEYLKGLAAGTESVSSAPSGCTSQTAEREGASYGFPIDIILLKENTGFSGAVNVGISAAKSEYVVLLNNDTEAQPGYLKALVEPFERDRHKKLFAVSPKMVQLYHQDLLDDAGDGYNLFGWAFQRGVGQSVKTPKFNRRTDVFSACAGAAAYRRSVFEEIRLNREKEEYEDLDGGLWPAHSYFDPLHFAYLEDLDVCFRARIHGYRVMYEPASVVLHVGSGTSGSKYNSFKVKLAARNNVYLNYKNMPLLMLLLNLPGILMGVIIKLGFFVKIGFGKDYIKGFMEGIRTLEKCRPHKTFFVPRRLLTYLGIECMLIRDTFSYIQDFAVRQAAKLGKK